MGANVKCALIKVFAGPLYTQLFMNNFLFDQAKRSEREIKNTQRDLWLAIILIWATDA